MTTCLVVPEEQRGKNLFQRGVETASHRANRVKNRFVLSYRQAMTLAFIMVMTVPSMAQSDSITVDTGAIFTNTNLWIPVMITILAIPAGIRIAMAIVQLIIDQFVGAFRR